MDKISFPVAQQATYYDRHSPIPDSIPLPEPLPAPDPEPKPNPNPEPIPLPEPLPYPDNNHLPLPGIPNPHGKIVPEEEPLLNQIPDSTSDKLEEARKIILGTKRDPRLYAERR